MSILETFFFMFDADTSGVKKGLDEGEKGADKLEKKLNETDAAAKKLGETFVSTTKQALSLAGAIAAFAVVARVTTQTAEHTNALQQQAKAMGVSTEALGTWRNAISSAGYDADAATQSLANLKTKFAEMTMFGGQSFAYMQLGLSSGDIAKSVNDPTIAMVKLAGTFQKMTEQQRLFYGKQLGLDPGTIQLLSKGSVELQHYLDLQRQLGVVTKEQAENAQKYKAQLNELSIVYETVRRELTSDFLPALTWMLDKIEQTILFFREHKTFALAFFGAIAAVLVNVYIPTVESAAAATWALIGPYVAVGVAVVALAALFALLLDDLWAFMHGHDSVIGEIAKKWPMFGEAVRATVNLIRAEFNTFLALIKGVWDYLASFLQFMVEVFTLGPSKALDRFNERTGKIFGEVRDSLKDMGDGFMKFFDVIMSPLKSFADVWDRVSDAVAKVYEKLPAGVKEGVKDVASFGAKVFDKLTGGEAERGKEIAAKLVKMGWTPQQAAGIAGSFLQESGGRADAKNKTSGAYGLGQWLGSRKKDFEAFSGKPLEGSSLDDQLKFFQYEVTQGKEKRAGDRLRATTTAADAAAVHSQYYERPGAAEANVARRQALAQNIAQAQMAMAETKSAPIATVTTAQTQMTNNQRALSVQTGDIHVKTAATDGKGTANAINESLRTTFVDTLGAFDNGVAI